MLRQFILLIPVLAILAMPVSAQKPIQRDIKPFTKLVVGDRIIVRLVKAEKESATIQVQGIDESAVKTDVSGDVLQISIYGEPFTKKKVLITLNFVNLKAITVTGGADVTTTSLFKFPELDVDLKSGGMLYIDADVENLRGKLVEGALMTAEGYATNMEITVSTTATLSAYELECEKINIKATSGGKAKINVDTELDADASTKAYISYKGNPSKINRNALSGATIEPYKP